MPEQSYGWLSLLPPLVAILMAIVTQRVFTSLFAGVLVGAAILHRGAPLATLAATCEGHLWPSLVDGDHLRVFVFTATMGAMVGVMRAAGGFEGIVRGLAPLARSRRAGQLTVWLLGLIVFFDDYANSLLLGNTMRPLTDRLRISREKLAYLVDSTAAPVSGLALVSTWVAGEIGFIREGFDGVATAAAVDGFSIFVATIPYRFYVLWALAMVAIVAITGRDFGAMLSAERAAAEGDPSPTDTVGKASAFGDWRDALLPIVAVVGVTVLLIMVTGSKTVAEDPNIESNLVNVFGNGDSYLALVYGALSGLGAAVLLAWARGTLSVPEIQDVALSGVRQVAPALVILWLAWTLSGLTGDLGTGEFLAAVLENALDVRWMPTVVFLLASAVAFATGTSWGTMGILMPLVISVTALMLVGEGAEVDPQHQLMIATIGSVLAGAIFGDHCSPISDTTVLSSQASGCHHIAHVRTQMPYALLVAVVSIVCGTLPVGYGAPAWLLLPTGLVVLIIFLRLCGRRVDD